MRCDKVGVRFIGELLAADFTDDVAVVGLGQSPSDE